MAGAWSIICAKRRSGISIRFAEHLENLTLHPSIDGDPGYSLPPLEAGSNSGMTSYLAYDGA